MISYLFNNKKIYINFSTKKIALVTSATHPTIYKRAHGLIYSQVLNTSY